MANLEEMFMDIALNTGWQSNCVKYRVGCVVVRDKRVILQGYNGTVTGFINCDVKFNKHSFVREDHSKWSSAVEIHAEMNVITYAAKKGIPLEGTVMYSTLKPCNNCLKHIVSTGIEKVIYKDDFVDNNEQEDASLLEELIELVKFEIQ